jgi:CheY-like chemotaxis protein
MFSIISHDLRGPIGNLIPLFDMFSNKETSEALRNELIKEMRRTTATTYDLLENLLSWSKFQTKSISLVPANFNVNDTIEEIVELYQNDANQKNISISIDSVGKNYVFADKNSVNLIIRNILYNAIKFTPKFGKISLKAQVKEGVVFVSITDSGIGMTEDVAKNIFNKDTFYTSYGTNNEIGTGLGLQLCREFVIKNGGKINVISKVGKGTTFEFTLPKGKHVSAKETLVIPKIKTNANSLINKKILLVEDDKFNLVYTKSLFEKWKVSYDVAGNGEEAISLLSVNKYDIVVMDLEMPVMDGITTCIHIRTQLKLDLPVIAISANIGSDIVEKTQRAGFTDYVSKPIDSGFLFVKIANALKIKVEGDEIVSGLTSTQYSQDSSYSSLEQLKLAFGDDMEITKEMIFKFLEVTPSYYKDMVYYYEISDFQNLRQIAHKLKSSIGFFTTEDLAHEVKLINDYAGTADTYNLEPVMIHFKEWFPKLCDELKLIKL